MRINHNIAALNTHRQLNSASNAQAKSMEKLSSGLRINRAGDDAAGLAISEKMRGQVRGLEQASRNSQDGISLIQTAEGALNETHDILQRMRELVVQGGNMGTNETEDLTAIQDEYKQLADEIDKISDRTQFNGKTLLNGDFATGTADLVFQIGANDTQQLKLNIDAMDSTTLGVDATTIDVSAFAAGADTDAALTAIDGAIDTVSAQRSSLGATQNRLEHTINNLNNASENLTAAESRIRDVDYALAA